MRGFIWSLSLCLLRSPDAIASTKETPARLVAG
jgi:hypothetical protein